MGLQINSGPKWEDDTLNDLNIESIDRNAKEMYHRSQDKPLMNLNCLSDTKRILSERQSDKKN